MSDRISRAEFIKTCSATAVAAALPAVWCNADDIGKDQELTFRFAVASDLHFAQPGTPSAMMTDEMIDWLNKEESGKGLDAVFLNGDLTHDSPPALLKLKTEHLAKLKTPYYTIKGNHDFVDEEPGSPTESWQKIWGYPSDHVVTFGDFAFIMANTSAPHAASTYLAADFQWLKQQLKHHRKARAVFVFIHIPQRKQGVDGWPKYGVHEPEEAEQGEAVMKLLESTKNVRAVFHGHNHNQMGHLVSGKRRYFFDSHVGGNWGAKRGYRIVEVFDDHNLVTYQVNAEDAKVANQLELPG